MKRQRTLTITLILSGIVLIVFSGFRWLSIYADPSSAFFGMISGGLLILCGYLNQRVSDLSEGQQDIHRGFDVFNRWVLNEFVKKKKVKRRRKRK